MEKQEEPEKTEEQLALEFPGYSTFEEREHCGCKMTYFPEIDTYFWGEWEFQPCMPSFVIFLIVSSYLICVTIAIPKFGYEWIISIPIFTFLCIIFLISYIQIIKVGPGYFPFYWGVKNILKTKENGAENDNGMSDYLLNKTACPYDGIMTNPEQYKWGHKLKKPTRSILARSAKRIVLRPDHLCGWTTVWIGKRNHKLFMLFNFYGILYLTFFCVYTIRAVVKDFDNLENLAEIIVLAIYGLFSLSFALLTTSFTCTSLCGFCHNITSWEDWNNTKVSIYDRGSCIKNMEDVCGPSTNMCNWLKPYSPFEAFTNEELAAQYNVEI